MVTSCVIWAATARRGSTSRWDRAARGSGGEVTGLSIVLPTLNAAATLRATIKALEAGRHSFPSSEMIVVDGGSTDDTTAIAAAEGANVIAAERGRGTQLAVGCAAAREPWLLALHADTCLSTAWPDAVMRHARRHPDRAGWFRFRLDDPSRAARVWETGVALRCALLALPYGDQGLLMSRRLYESVGGFRPLPLMEDVDLTRRLGRRRLRALDAVATTSAERFRRRGYLAQSVRNWTLLALFLLGADAAALARRYD